MIFNLTGISVEAMAKTEMPVMFAAAAADMEIGSRMYPAVLLPAQKTGAYAEFPFEEFAQIVGITEAALKGDLA